MPAPYITAIPQIQEDKIYRNQKGRMFRIREVHNNTVAATDLTTDRELTFVFNEEKGFFQTGNTHRLGHILDKTEEMKTEWQVYGWNVYRSLIDSIGIGPQNAIEALKEIKKSAEEKVVTIQSLFEVKVQGQSSDNPSYVDRYLDFHNDLYTNLTDADKASETMLKSIQEVIGRTEVILSILSDTETWAIDEEGVDWHIMALQGG